MEKEKTKKRLTRFKTKCKWILRKFDISFDISYLNCDWLSLAKRTCLAFFIFKKSSNWAKEEMRNKVRNKNSLISQFF